MAPSSFVSRSVPSYKLESWTPEREIVLTANENYWGEPPKAPKAIIQWSTEAAQRLLELQSGTVDGIDNPGPDDFDAIGRTPTWRSTAHGAEHLLSRLQQRVRAVR